MLDKQETIKAMGSAIEKLTALMVQRELKLSIAENRARGWNPRRCNDIRKEIESIRARLERAERLQDRAVSGS